MIGVVLFLWTLVGASLLGHRLTRTKDAGPVSVPGIPEPVVVAPKPILPARARHLVATEQTYRAGLTGPPTPRRPRRRMKARHRLNMIDKQTRLRLGSTVPNPEKVFDWREPGGDWEFPWERQEKLDSEADEIEADDAYYEALEAWQGREERQAYNMDKPQARAIVFGLSPIKDFEVGIAPVAKMVGCPVSTVLAWRREATRRYAWSSYRLHEDDRNYSTGECVKGLCGGQLIKYEELTGRAA